MLIDKKYNPEKHHRQSLRLRGFDYSRCGIYFITFCCQDKISRFGKIDTGLMICNEFGNIALTQMAELPIRFHTVEIDTFQIMPNHIHMIIVLHPVGATLAVAPTNDHNQNMAYKSMRARVNRAPTVGNIVGSYKSLVANQCLKLYKSKNELMGKFWQRNFYEHIIRNNDSLQMIRNYILENPVKWNEDEHFVL